MYIGKAGQSRKYFCPLYKCTEEGDEVSPFVIDEELEIPNDPLHGLGKEERKQAVEMSVFKSFASAAGLSVDDGSASNAGPPFPDIRCTIAGEVHWFELGQIISNEVAARINPKRHASDGGFSFSQEIPFVEIVTKKATKAYETQGCPVHLVLHFDLRLGHKNVVLGQIEKHTDRLKALVANGPFARVWIYDDWTKCILWSAGRED